MTKSVATLNHTRGTSIVFGLRATPAYAGNETVTCDIKCVDITGEVPPENSAVIHSITPIFIPTDRETPAYWSFVISPEITATFQPGEYITDARIELNDGSVLYPAPLSIIIMERVTV